MFNAINFISGLPSNIKRNVLFSMVGSLNASLIGTATSMLRRFKANGEDIKELSAAEINHLMLGPDWVDGTRYVRNVNMLAQRWRDDLVALTDMDNAGSLSETIDFMIKSPRKLDDDLLVATLAAAGINDVPTDIIKAKHEQMQRERSEQLAAQRGEIEWLIEQGFTPDLDEDGDYDEPKWEMLSEEQRDSLNNKLLDALKRTRDTAVLGVLQRDRRWSFGDLPILQAAIAEVEAL